MQPFARRLRASTTPPPSTAPRYIGERTWLVEVTPNAPALDESSLPLVDAVRAARRPAR